MDAFGAAFVVALAGLLALAIWKVGARFFRWCAAQLKAAYLDWFKEAVDKHIEPKLDAVKANTVVQAAQIKKDAESTADTVREELRKHTEDEGHLVRMVVREEIAPLRETLDAHVASDSESFARIESSLTKIEGSP